MQILSYKSRIYLPPQLKLKDIAGGVICASFLTSDFQDFSEANGDFVDLGWE